jgi:hypothetical protein
MNFSGAQAARRTFVRVVEYWVPSADGTLLEFGGGLFGSASRFAAATERLCFGRGEGLPGQAWELGHPIVLKDLQDSYFRRAAAARVEGLTCGIAMPIFVAGALTAVVVLFCGDDDAHAGAIELWRNQPDESPDMTLVDGYYGTTGDTFEFISRATAFRPGTGLPGQVWKSMQPVFLPDLGKGSGFLRADTAVKVGINRGFALPCSTTDGSVQVIAFLSALATPIATAVEIWGVDATGRTVRHYGFAETDAPLSDAGEPAAQALASARPVATARLIAIPVAPQGQVTSVVVLHF